MRKPIDSVRLEADLELTMSKEMTGADMVIQALADQGVEHLFGYPGGAALPIYDALFQQPKVQHILVRHGQGAVHAAEGYARSTGKVGCVLVTSGPGATNAVTGLTDALMDSTPLVCLTGQVPTHLIGNDAFQECDTVGITRPCTKHNYLVKNVSDLPRVLHEAFHIAKSGRPGPVVVDIPKDIQFARGLYSRPKDFQHKGYRPKVKGDLERIKVAIELMRHAKRALFYTGGGVVNSGPEATQLLRELVKLTGFPITSTLMGLGAYAASDPQWLGMLGMHGTYEANMSMHDCDLMICIGARFDDRNTYITTEVGQHQMWAAQFYRFEQPNRWMTSGGLGTMGYGLPAAVGVQLAHPNSLVIDIAGEASVLMTMQEMSTAVQYELPIKIFIINNQYMGMVRQWQELLHGGRYAHSYTEALPDFVKLAEAYHAVGIRCERPGDLDGAIAEMIKVQKPVIFDCVVDPAENCFPMIPSGRAHNEMLLGRRGSSGSSSPPDRRRSRR